MTLPARKPDWLRVRLPAGTQQDQFHGLKSRFRARRLHTVMEKLLEDVSFDAPDLTGSRLVVDETLVRSRLGPLVEDEDLSRFIL